MQENSKKKKLIAGGVLAVIILAAVSLSVFPTTADTSPTAVIATPAKEPEATTASTPTPAVASAAATAIPTTATPKPVAATGYKNGTFTASASYRTPESTETINVTITISNGVVTGSSVSQTPQDRKSALYQKDFANGYKAYVEGRNIESISLSRVSGSSLTSSGFNKALAAIKSQAKA